MSSVAGVCGGPLLPSLLVFAAIASIHSITVAGKDPAEGWLSYATASCPAGTRLTRFEGKWLVPAMARASNTFYSPWIGSDTSDNMNLIQPVNPWRHDSWHFYSEYYQWSPTHNQNSETVSCAPGDEMWGVITYNGADAYTIMQHDMTTGTRSGMTIPVQRAENGEMKNYTILYVVFEKAYDCADYPPDEFIRFFDLTVECDWREISPRWTTSYVKDVCEFRAHVVDDRTITMTWNTSAPNRRNS